MVWYCVARYGVVSPGVAQPVWCGVVTVMRHGLMSDVAVALCVVVLLCGLVL